MFCPYCGNETPEEGLFCGNCGNKLPAAFHSDSTKTPDSIEILKPKDSYTDRSREEIPMPSEEPEYENDYFSDSEQTTDNNASEQKSTDTLDWGYSSQEYSSQEEPPVFYTEETDTYSTGGSDGGNKNKILIAAAAAAAAVLVGLGLFAVFGHSGSGKNKVAAEDLIQEEMDQAGNDVLSGTVRSGDNTAAQDQANVVVADAGSASGNNASSGAKYAASSTSGNKTDSSSGTNIINNNTTNNYNTTNNNTSNSTTNNNTTNNYNTSGGAAAAQYGNGVYLTSSVVSSKPSGISGYSQVKVSSASASSTLRQGIKGITNDAMVMFDGNDKTSWQESASGHGIGESVSIRFNGTYNVKYIAFKIGNWRWDKGSGVRYRENNRPKTVTLDFGTHYATVTFSDSQTVQYVELSEEVNASEMRVILEDVYLGTKDDDTCINEITIYGKSGSSSSSSSSSSSKSTAQTVELKDTPDTIFDEPFEVYADVNEFLSVWKTYNRSSELTRIKPNAKMIVYGSSTAPGYTNKSSRDTMYYVELENGSFGWVNSIYTKKGGGSSASTTEYSGSSKEPDTSDLNLSEEMSAYYQYLIENSSSIRAHEDWISEYWGTDPGRGIYFDDFNNDGITDMLVMQSSEIAGNTYSDRLLILTCKDGSLRTIYDEGQMNQVAGGVRYAFLKSSSDGAYYIYRSEGDEQWTYSYKKLAASGTDLSVSDKLIYNIDYGYEGTEPECLWNGSSISEDEYLSIAETIAGNPSKVIVKGPIDEDTNKFNENFNSYSPKAMTYSEAISYLESQ